ncbi:MAG TPA: DMT family transporter [Actinomycetales bacterium]|nr:DMT family transporter [Actinomycetales bacterium]
MLGVVIALGLVAAVLYALSDFMEQREAQRARQRETDEGRGLLGRIATGAGRLLRDRRWFAGWALGTLAYLVQAAALHLGSISVVQSLQVTTLVFSLPLSTVGRRERPRVRDLLAASSVCLGLAMFLVARGAGTTTQGEPDRPRLVLVLVVVGAAVTALCLASIRRQGPMRAVLLGVAAGATYGTSATMVKLTAQDLTTRGVAATAADWPGYALAVLAIGSVVLQQLAFANGRLPTATTAIVVTNPVVGALAGIVGFHERIPTDALRLSLMAAAAVPLVAGLIVLPRSPLLRTEEPRVPE